MTDFSPVTKGGLITRVRIEAVADSLSDVQNLIDGEIIDMNNGQDPVWIEEETYKGTHNQEFFIGRKTVKFLSDDDYERLTKALNPLKPRVND